ncbi:MAG: hypothetical protein IPL58_13135 [Betaproteobacteria bacterium]|uniref:Uncharacterized protein n=1 Tax=Candidatus Proximibacter danicus TaxID=2954365 RepID=A0A9D7K1X7_9PROT|nr:hypothetical protein [Candidatus Proximibacter danicus]
MRFEMDGSNLSVMPDKPFLRTYKIDFLNMSRNVKSVISTQTQIATASAAAPGTQELRPGGTGGNTASTLISSDTKNDLMESLISNVTDMLKKKTASVTGWQSSLRRNQTLSLAERVTLQAISQAAQKQPTFKERRRPRQVPQQGHRDLATSQTCKAKRNQTNWRIRTICLGIRQQGNWHPDRPGDRPST